MRFGLSLLRRMASNMKNIPPICINLNSFVVEFAFVDSSVVYKNTKNLNVGGEWLGKVPQLAICKEIATKKYFLSHCNVGWDELCFVQSRDTIDKIKKVAEKNYQGISRKGSKTGYKKKNAIKIINKSMKKHICPFCNTCIFEMEKSMEFFRFESGLICKDCILSLYEEISKYP